MFVEIYTVFVDPNTRRVTTIDSILINTKYIVSLHDQGDYAILTLSTGKEYRVGKSTINKLVRMRLAA